MAIFESVGTFGHEQVLFCSDNVTGLKAIIAVHDTTLGPALGGCRMWNYKNEEEAITDVLRLSRGMTYKAAVAGLNLGGGKAVILGDPKKLKNEAFFRTFGRFVDSLGGRYITAEDVNINVRDMEYVAIETKYVSGLSGGSGDPSPMTAAGVYHGIRAAVKYKLNKDSLRGLKVSVQGCGAVGTYLCELLHQDGVKLYVSDIDAAKVQNIVTKYGAESVTEEQIYKLPVDVFAPCALGAIINEDTIPVLQTPIIAGGANNQLRNDKVHGPMVRERGILYAPDYVINAGGLINVYHELKGYDAQVARQKAANIYNTLIEIFTEADRENISTHVASDRLAERRINSVRSTPRLGNGLHKQLWTKH